MFREWRRKISAVRAQKFWNRPQNLDVTRTGNGERETGIERRKGKRGTGHLGTGVWEPMHSGDPRKNLNWGTKLRKRRYQREVLKVIPQK